MKDRIDRRILKDKLAAWLAQIERDSPVPAEIAALNFGLFEPYGVELIGAKVYDPDDEDWACCEDYVPEQRSCPGISIPASIGWEEVLQVFLEVLRELSGECDYALWSTAHITAGFCDGNLHVIK